MRKIKSILGIAVKEIIHQDLYERERRNPVTQENYTCYYYDVEFKDKRDGYHHYKSCFDKGVVVFTDGTVVDFDALPERCIDS